MAISQGKYININTDVQSTYFGERTYSGLVFSADSMVSGAPTDIKTEYDTNFGIVALSLSDVAKCFGDESDQYKFAERYFSYLSNEGTSPAVLNFIRTKTKTELSSTADETPSAALARANDLTNDFGSFTFLSTDGRTFTDDELVSAASTNSGYDHRYLHAVGYVYSDTAEATTKMAKFEGAIGTNVYFGADKFGAAIAMSILASIDFDRKDSTVCFMFKTVSGETYTIDNDTDYETMKSINANFYGLVQSAGTRRAFLQCGFNSDGEDSGVYVNEMWLKSEIATAYLNLAMNHNKIPANATGEALIHATISPIVTNALKNGAIIPDKNISDSDRIAIYQFTGSDSAADCVATNGYWLGVNIEKAADGNYVAYYYLPYSKGDAIRLCKGYHKLV